MKGRSPQMQKTPERIPLVEALEGVCSLFNKWGVDTKNYILVDEFAYVLQGYDVEGTEVESGHLDVYVNPQSLPWAVKEERSIVPPKDSIYMADWTAFMQTTGYGLDMLRAKPEIFEAPSIIHVLPSRNTVQTMRAYEMTEAFVQQTIMHYSLEDVGKEKIIEWVNKLEIIRGAAEKKNDGRLAKLCEDKLVESRKKWGGIL
jgi:hypothetical protein